MGFFVLDEANDRHRVIEGIKGRAATNQLKQFRYNGTAQDYDKKTKELSSGRENRNMIRGNIKEYNDYKKQLKLTPEGQPKPKNPKDETHPAVKAAARYNPVNKTIGINQRAENASNRSGGSIQPVVNHEKQHYKQDMIARNTFGRQGSRMMFKKESDRVDASKHPDGYKKSTLEYNANQAAIGSPKPTHQMTQSVVNQNIQTKKFNGPKLNVTANQGLALKNQVNNKFIPPKK